MPLTKAQCPNCGGALEVDASKEAAVCPFCNTPYIVEKAINNYVTNVTNNIQADTVIVQAGSSDDEKANKLLNLASRAREDGDYVKADEYYQQVLLLKPDSWEAYFFTTALKALATGALSIPSAEASLIRCHDKTITLIKNLADKSEQIAAIKLVAPFGSATFSKLYDNAKHYYLTNGLNGADKDRFAESTNTAIRGSYALGDAIDSNFRDYHELHSYIVSAWKSGISLDQKTMNYFFADKSEKTQRVSNYSSKIRVYDPSYSTPEPPAKKGCYVATCVYGSYDCPQVWTLRRYRDDTLAATWYGRAFIRAYYAVSPTLVKWFGKTKWFKKLWQGKLDRMVKRLNDEGVENTPYQDRNW